MNFFWTSNYNLPFSKHEIFKFFYFCGSFLPSWPDWIESNKDPDPDPKPFLQESEKVTGIKFDSSVFSNPFRWVTGTYCVVG